MESLAKGNLQGGVPNEAVPPGVMTATYGQDRRTQPHLAFRLETRALIAAQVFREFTSTGSGPPSILDLGAADGATLDRVHRTLGARDSLGIEYAPELIAEARDLPADVRLVQGDVTAVHPQVAESSRDLVLALAILEHLESPVDLFRQAYRALKPGGLIVATCPSGFWDELSGMLRLHPDEHHERAFDRNTFESLAVEGAFEVVTYRRFMCAPVAFLPYLRIPVASASALGIDAALRRLRIFDWTFVNQLFVARKPNGSAGASLL
ncbi:MAG: trans-aconitate 2-methyltransferase [Myxococcota bacterium]